MQSRRTVYLVRNTGTPYFSVPAKAAKTKVSPQHEVSPPLSPAFIRVLLWNYSTGSPLVKVVVLCTSSTGLQLQESEADISKKNEAKVFNQSQRMKHYVH